VGGERGRQLEVLQHDPHVQATPACQRALALGAQFLASEDDPVTSGPIEACVQVEQSGLTPAGIADHGDSRHCPFHTLQPWNCRHPLEPIAAVG